MAVREHTAASPRPGDGAVLVDGATPRRAESRRASPPTIALVAEDEGQARRITATLARAGIRTRRWRGMVGAGLARERDAPRVAVVACETLRGLAGTLAHVRSLGSACLIVAPRATGSDVRAALAAGADGLVLDETLEECLVPAVDAVSAGLLVLPRVDRRAVTPPALSVREKQVLGLVVLGLSNSEIAAKLHIAETTVKSHLRKTFRKLGVRSRSEASARVLDPHDGFGIGILSIAEDDLALDLFDRP